MAEPSKFACDKFNHYFTTVGSQSKKIKSTQKLALNHTFFSLYMEKTSEIGVLNKINCFSIKICPDVYHFNVFAMNKLNFSIVPALTNIPDPCTMHSFFLDVFKFAKITPIHKNGDISKLRNFRLVSILPTEGKVFCSFALQSHD